MVTDYNIMWSGFATVTQRVGAETQTQWRARLLRCWPSTASIITHHN